MIKLGSLFAGVGGFELGLERAIPGLKTVWQVEQNKFCQQVLKKHWKNSKIYDDVKTVGKHNLEPVDMLCGGFPCQDISVSGKGKGINEGEKSSLWWEMWRIIGELRPRIVVLENVPAITFRGLNDVLGSLASIGYDSEWCIISASQFGAPHLRKRWFCVAYSNSNRTQVQIKRKHSSLSQSGSSCKNRKIRSYWQGFPTQSPLCNRNDGVSDRVARLRALGNAIVPQCSQYIGECIFRSGLLEER